MADKTLDLSYAEVLDPLIRGSLRHHTQWPEWFAATKGDFGKRVAKIVEDRGYVPTPEQFYQAQVQLRQEAFGEEPSDPKAGAAELAAQDEGKTAVAEAPKPGEPKKTERKRAGD